MSLVSFRAAEGELGREPRNLAGLTLTLSASFLLVVAAPSAATAVGQEGPVPAPQPESRPTMASLLTAIGKWAESQDAPHPMRPAVLFARPLDGAVMSPFGWRFGRQHTGVDIDGDTGDRVVAAAAGTVVHAGSYFGYGETIMIDHGSGFATLYGHLSRIDVAVGREVKLRQAIGLVGCTGACTGDHLHFEILIESEPVDPLPFLNHGRVVPPEPSTTGREAVVSYRPPVR